MEPKYLRGAFAVYPPGALLQDPHQLIPFRFNPMNLERTLRVVSGAGDAGLELAGADAESRTSHKRAADSASGALTESFTVEVRFDFEDRHASMNALPPELGIAPEIAALELMLQSAESPVEATKGKAAVAPRGVRPTVLFIWGRMRVLPVRITSLVIDETVFNAELNPTRAEAKVGLEVVAPTNDAAPVVKAALQFTQGRRQSLARLFHSTVAAQGAGSILPL